MSCPISECMVRKAASSHLKGDATSRTALVAVLRENLRLGHWTQCGCPHKPKCHEDVSDGQFQAFWDGVCDEISGDKPAGQET